MDKKQHRTIFDKIDSMSRRRYEDVGKRDSQDLRSWLYDHAPVEYTDKKGNASRTWKTHVNKYCDAQEKVEEWNGLSIN